MTYEGSRPDWDQVRHDANYDTPECAPKLPEQTPEQREYPRKVRIRGCGHGECTTADTPCRYDESTIGMAMSSAPAGGTAEVWLRMNGATQPDGVRWTAADLDRCEHGRHSADHCFDCPGGHSTGNPFLLSDRVQWVPSLETREVDGRVEVRIGTMVRGEPIWVVVRDKPREASVTEDDKLPCSECGHRVRPGLHTQAECIKNQQDDAAATVASIENPEEQTNGE